MATRNDSSALTARRRDASLRCKRWPWFALDCLVEQAEFELRCGLQAALRPTVAAWGISAKQLLIEAAASAAVRLSFAPQASPNIWCRSWFDALGYYAEATALAEETGELQLLFPCHDGLATLYLDLDEPEQAERYMCKAKEICERAGIDLDSRMVLPYLA